ncbi:hypothetical protein QZH41_006033 [Actinostola sp. cb2023]|nr:hypothetical protein QZH41_006033 [Actinostola sp. cb2023]
MASNSSASTLVTGLAIVPVKVKAPVQSKNAAVECRLLNLEVFDLKQEHQIDLPNVYSMHKLPVSSADIATRQDIDRWPHLKGIELTAIDADVGLLIGCDVPEALQPQDIRISQNGGPYATRTLLGWTVNGPLGKRGNNTPTANHIRADAELSHQFERFCNFEFNDSEQDGQAAMSRNDEKALRAMEETVQLKASHYEMALPWKNSPPCLENNRTMAEHRLNLLKRRLQKDESTFQRYKAFIDDLISKGHARKIPSSEEHSSPVWYLPHHPVYHPQKPNKGPDLTNSLVGVLTRFRQEPVALMADIEAMFYQVRVRPSDRNCLRFLWWPSGDFSRTPEEYQIKTATDNEKDFDPTTVNTVLSNFYVDDCLKSVATTAKAIRLTSQLRQLLARERALGVQWNVQADTSVYDPLGFVSPVILTAKMILQELCRKKLKWDDIIPEKELRDWETWLKDLPKLEQFAIKRCFKPQYLTAIKSCELHHFSDASELGYGAASYLRLVTETGQVHCALVMAKSRLTPLKHVIIPRLELTAAVLATRLDRMIRKEIADPIDKSTFWTDSTCVLRYIRNQEKRFQVFVANRVTKILSQSEETQWRYVDTASNPADEASRDNDPERIAAWILRYKSKLQQATARRKANDHVKFQAASEIHPIEVVELQNAESALLRHVQKRCFSEELLILKPVNPLCDLRKKIAVQKGSNIYKLDPILMDGLIRVGGRLHRAPIDDETRHPIVLPKKHHIVELITSCRRRQAPAARQKMASLPADRITPSKPPFTYVGVDCFGPFEVRRGRTHVKRRGLPIEMRSDNGGNFVKGERELREAIRDWNQAQIHDYLLQRNIKWTFNPPAGSHHGGVWERCIRTVRKVMKAVVREQTLDDEGLNTLMCEAESIINSRPLTKLSDDPRDMEPLTPNHLLLYTQDLQPHPGHSASTITTLDGDGDKYSTWPTSSANDGCEYLPSLQERQKWNKEYRNFQVNDIVLVLDENSPRCSWPLGRILEVYNNRRDGLVRSVKLKTRTTILVRPIDKIVLLEAATVSTNDNFSSSVKNIFTLPRCDFFVLSVNVLLVDFF